MAIIELPKIKMCHYNDYKYQFGRNSRGWWSLEKTKWEAIKLWFLYLCA